MDDDGIVQAGEQLAFSWETNKRYCTASGGWDGAAIIANKPELLLEDTVAARSLLQLKNVGTYYIAEGIVQDTDFQLTCVDALGDTTAQTQTIRAMVAPGDTTTDNAGSDAVDTGTETEGTDAGADTTATSGTPNISLTATPASVSPGSFSVLTWSAASVWNCALSAMGEQVAASPQTSYTTPALYTTTYYQLSCSNSTTDARETANVVVTVAALPENADPNAGDDEGSGTGGSTDTDPLTSEYILAFDVSPENVASDGVVQAHWKVADMPMLCTLVGTQNTQSVELARMRYNEAIEFTRDISIGERFDDGVVAMTLACGPTVDGVSFSTDAQQRVVNVRVGAAAGIRYFTADTFHLNAPGKVWVSWDHFGMTSCAVDRDTLENKEMFDLLARARSWDLNWSENGESYYINQTTQFTLTCEPEDGSAVQKKTITVSVGDYAADTPIEGTQNVAYVQYCPFEVSSEGDHIVRFGQRLEWAGQKDIVNTETIPAGVYSVWASSADSFDGRSYQDQPNERYFIELYGADGDVVAQTGVTDDLNSDTANGAVTLQAEQITLAQVVSSVAAVHAEGENASVNPGCLLLKYTGSGELDTDPEEDSSADTVACPADAKVCADGSAVGRVAPSCDFAACPEDDNSDTVACPAVMKECPDGTLVGYTPGTCTYAACPTEQTDKNNTQTQIVTRAFQTSPAQTALAPVCSTRWSSNVSDVFAAPNGLTDTRCVVDDIVVYVGKDGNENYFTWNEAYYTTDGDSLNHVVQLNGQLDATGQWIIGQGEAVIPGDASGQNYIATYTCVREGDGWLCGCKNGSQNCSQPESGNFIWNLTGYSAL